MGTDQPANKTSKAWEAFDRLASAAVRREITFDQFARRADGDFCHMARIAARKRRLPTWMGVDDVKSQLVELAWHYLFTRECRNGAVGFDQARYESAGAYCRWKIRTKIGKVISRAKGENQHTRRGPGSPEFLSKTGELPEVADISAEELALASIEFSKLERICATAAEFAVLRAITQCVGDEARVTGYLVENGVVKDAAGARREVAKFHAKVFARSQKKMLTKKERAPRARDAAAA